MNHTVFYVSPMGNDGSDGLSPEKNGQSGPFQTLFRARNAVRALKNAGSADAFTVLVRGGKYCLDHSLLFLSQDAGAPEAPVVWKAYEDEKPILSGGQPITGWKPYKDGIFVADVPQTATGYSTRQLFYKGVRMQRACFPKHDPEKYRVTGWLFMEGGAFVHEDDVTHDQSSGEWKIYEHEDFMRAFHYKEGDGRKYAHPEQIEMAVSPMLGWFTLYLQVKNIDEARRMIVMNGQLPDYRRLPWTNDVVFNKNNRFRFENALEDLTMPGEWVLDKREGKVYFMPPDGQVADGDVVLPQIPCVVDLRMTQHITFEGFTFTETLDCGDDWHREGMNGYGAMFPHQGNAYNGESFHFYHSSWCVLRNNEFRYCGNNAVYVEGDSCNNLIAHNKIAYAGANGITVIGNEARHPRNTRITDNDIHHCGEILNYVAGVFLGCCDGTTVAHNRLHDLPHHAVNMATNGFGRNLIEYNDIRRVTLEINDTGAINSWMDDPGEGHRMLAHAPRSGHIIRYNWISDVQGMEVDEEGNVTGTSATRGIYLDDGSSNCVVYGNCLVRCHTNMLLHCCMHNYVTNNMFIDFEKAMDIGDGVSSRVGNEDIIGFQRGHHIEGNVFFTRKEGVIYFAVHKYDETLLHCCDGNFIYSTQPMMNYLSTRLYPNSFHHFDMSAWQAIGYDVDSAVGIDPGFVDPDHDDFRLVPSSPVLAAGFQPIPFDKIGPRPMKPEAPVMPGRGVMEWRPEK